MKLLLFEAAYARIKKDIADVDGRVQICQMTKDGDVLLEGQRQNLDSFSPDLAWLSMDLMYHGKVQEFVRLVSNSKTLKWVQTANAGLDNPIYGKIAATGTRLSNSDAQALPIAEYVIGHVLHCFQGIEHRLEAQRNKKWRYRQFREISGSTWLIIGFGNIGQRIAVRARAFEANIVGVRHSKKEHPLADRIVGQSDIPSELPNADVVVLACPITDDTKNMANGAFFAAMKKDSILVNIARGDLIEDDALLAALDQGRPAHAVLDAFSEEPLPKDHSFWTHPGVIVTAHTSNAGDGLLKRGDALFAGNLKKFLAGEPLKNEVDMPAAFPEIRS